jgi:hypothetical protein
LNDATKSVNISTNPPDMLNADGKDGYGFRLAPQGRVYGPYGGTELFDKSMVGGYPVFVDAWGGTIHYDGHKIWAISPSGEEINNSTTAQ